MPPIALVRGHPLFLHLVIRVQKRLLAGINMAQLSHRAYLHIRFVVISLECGPGKGGKVELLRGRRFRRFLTALEMLFNCDHFYNSITSLTLTESILVFLFIRYHWNELRLLLYDWVNFSLVTIFSDQINSALVAIFSDQINSAILHSHNPFLLYLDVLSSIQREEKHWVSRIQLPRINYPSNFPFLSFFVPTSVQCSLFSFRFSSLHSISTLATSNSSVFLFASLSSSFLPRMLFDYFSSFSLDLAHLPIISATLSRHRKHQISSFHYLWTETERNMKTDIIQSYREKWMNGSEISKDML